MRFLDHRVYRTFLAPARGGLKIVSAALTPIFKAITRLVGAEVISDVIAFFAAFEGLDQGFRDRAESINAVLRDRATNYIVVTSPEAEPMREATFLIGELTRQHISISALICNALTPDFGTPTAPNSQSPHVTLRFTTFSLIVELTKSPGLTRFARPCAPKYRLPWSTCNLMTSRRSMN